MNTIGDWKQRDRDTSFKNDKRESILSSGGGFDEACSKRRRFDRAMRARFLGAAMSRTNSATPRARMSEAKLSAALRSLESYDFARLSLVRRTRQRGGFPGECAEKSTSGVFIRRASPSRASCKSPVPSPAERATAHHDGACATCGRFSIARGHTHLLRGLGQIPTLRVCHVRHGGSSRFGWPSVSGLGLTFR